MVIISWFSFQPDAATTPLRQSGFQHQFVSSMNGYSACAASEPACAEQERAPALGDARITTAAISQVSAKQHSRLRLLLGGA